MLRTGGRRDLDYSAARAIPVTANASLPARPRGQTAVTWVGHATFVVQIGGATILTDPVWSRKIPGVRERLTPPGIALDAVGPIDAVVISHNHYDHLDAPTIRQIPGTPRCSCPACSARGSGGATSATSSSSTGGSRCAWATSGSTSCPRTTGAGAASPTACKTLWGGWILRTDDRTVYFAGDTGYGHWFGEIGARYPGHRPGAAADRRVRAELVHETGAHEPGRGRPGLRGPGRATDGHDALGHVRAVGRAAAGAAGESRSRLGPRPADRERISGIWRWAKAGLY